MALSGPFLRAAIFLLLPAFNASATTLRYFPTDLENYVSPSLVEALAFDSDGAVWIATLRGVHKITEQSLLEATIEPTTRVTAGSSVAQIMPMGEAVFLTSTRGDLFKLTDGDIKLILESPTIQMPIRPPFRIQDQSVGILTEHGIHHVEVSSASVKPKTTLYEGNFTSNAVFTDDYGICAASHSSLICGVDGPPGQQFELFALDENSDIFYIDFSGENQTVAALTSMHTLVEFHVSHGITRTRIQLSEINGEPIRAFARWKHYALIGTDRGVLTVDLKSKSQNWLNLDENLRTVAFVEDNGGVWVLHEAGVSLIAESSVRNWPSLQDSSAIEVLSIDGAGDRTIAGTFDGLYFVDLDSAKPAKAWPQSKLSSKLDLRITAVAHSRSRVYAGTFSGALHTLSIERARIDYIDTMPLPSGVSALLYHQEELLIGTSQHGLFVLQNDNLEPLEMPISWKKKPTPITNIIKPNYENSVIVTSENEIIEICTSESFQVCGVQTLSGSLAGSTLLDATNLDNGSLLIGTVSAGVLQTNKSEIRQGTILNENSIKIDLGAPVFSVDATDNGLIVLGTDDGVLITDRDFMSVGQFHRYHGLLNYNVNHGATHWLDKDTLAVGGRFGVSSLDVSDLKRGEKDKRTIRLTSVTVPVAGNISSDSVKSVAQISLNYPESRLVLEFSVGDYRKILRNQYSYSLLGFDDSSREKYGRGRVEYRQIPPGKYTFQARGADAQGVWSDNQLSIPIIVHPPWWRSATALWLYCLSSLLTIGLCHRWVLQHRRRKKELAFASEQARALARLEDYWQEERGAAERVLHRFTPAVVDLLDVTRLLFTAHLSARDGDSVADDVDAIQSKLTALQKQQELCTRTTQEDKSNLHQLVEELFATISSTRPGGNRYILLNDTLSIDVPSGHAQYLSLIVHEVVCLLVDTPEATADTDPVIQVAIVVDEVNSSSMLRYNLLASERLKRPISEFELEAALPVTFQLVEDLGGDIQQLDRLGLEIEVNVLFDLNMDDQ